MGRTIEDLEHNVSGFCRAPVAGEGIPPLGAQLIASPKPRIGETAVRNIYACGATWTGTDKVPFTAADREVVLETCRGCPGLPEAVEAKVEAGVR